MRVAVFSTKPYDRTFLGRANADVGHELVFLEPQAEPETAPLAEGFPVVCVFVHDVVGPAGAGGSRRGRACASSRCGRPASTTWTSRRREELGIAVCRVPAYSPYAVAEHAVALILALDRRTHRAFNRVREGNFALDGLLGFDLHGRTVGIVGTGRIGAVFARIMAGLRLPPARVGPVPERGRASRPVRRTCRSSELFAEADIIALHAPLTPETHHLIDREALARMKRGVMLVNTSRGGLIDTEAVIEALKDGTIGYLGLDVYEEEDALFFEDLSQEILQDDVFARLLTFPNVLVTAHQAFFTEDALRRIAQTTVENIAEFARDGRPIYEVPG